jgi:hypothetical protein
LLIVPTALPLGFSRIVSSSAARAERVANETSKIVKAIDVRRMTKLHS